MSRVDRRLTIFLPALAIAFAASFRPGEVRSQKFVYSDPPDSLHPRVQYADGSISLNDRCAVRMIKLSRSMRPIYVNGQPIGFC